MSERHKTHNGRDLDGNFKVRQDDVEDKLEDPNGVDYIRDEVKLGGAVEDIGLAAGERAQVIGDLIDLNKYEVDHLTGKDRSPHISNRRRPPHKHEGNH